MMCQITNTTTNDAPADKQKSHDHQRSWETETFIYRQFLGQHINKFPVVYIQYRAWIPMELMVNMQARACTK